MKSPNHLFWFWTLLVVSFATTLARGANSAAFSADSLTVAPAVLKTGTNAAGAWSVWETNRFIAGDIRSTMGFYAVGFPGTDINKDGYSSTHSVAGGTFTLAADTRVAVEAYAAGRTGNLVQTGAITLRDSANSTVFRLDRDTRGEGFRSFLEFLWPDAFPGPGAESRYNHKSFAAYGTDATLATPGWGVAMQYRKNLFLSAGTYTVSLASTSGFTAMTVLVYLPKSTKDVELRLKGDLVSPTASLSASSSSYVLGESVTLTLGQSLAASSGRSLAGPGMASDPVLEPAGTVVSTPTSAGSANYTYTVPGGSVSLQWRVTVPGGTFVLNLPDGAPSVDVTGYGQYAATIPGTYTLTYTDPSNVVTVSDPVTVVLPAPAVATVSVMVKEKPGDELSVRKVIPQDLPQNPAPERPGFEIPSSGLLPEPVAEVETTPTPNSVPTADPVPEPASSSNQTSGSVVNVDTLPAVPVVPSADSAVTPTAGVDPVIPATPTPASVPAVVSVKPTLRLVESSVEVSAPDTVYHGKHYKRGWMEGASSFAYLGRSGVRFEGACSGVAGLRTMQLEAKSSAEAAEWKALSEGAVVAVSGSSVQGDCVCSFVVRLGEVKAEAPLVPLSYAEGHALTGQWLFRVRVSDAAGVWSEWSEEFPVQVVLPMSVKEETVQTLPPAGAEGEWFSASAPKTFRIGLWIP